MRRQPRGAEEPNPQRTSAAGFFVRREEQGMPNHLTPDELSKEVGIERDEVIRICLEEHVPIYQGKIDKTLFQAQLTAIDASAPKH
jgi:hypothetical protein